MCTVTYLPISGNTFLLTSSRNEQLKRKAARFPVYTQTALMNRENKVATISITTVAVEADITAMYYKDLQQDIFVKESMNPIVSLQLA